MPAAAFTIERMKDREILFAVEELADERGLVNAEDLAQEIGIDGDHPAQKISSRLAWMVRMGILYVDKRETDGNGRNLYGLTDEGFAAIHPKKLSRAAQEVLDNLDPSQKMEVTEKVAGALRKGPRATAHLSRRAWTNGVAGWKDPKLSPKRA